MSDHLDEMRRAIELIDDPTEALFFKVHLQGMEQLLDLEKQWLNASIENRPGFADQITTLSTKLFESLEILRPRSPR